MSVEGVRTVVENEAARALIASWWGVGVKSTILVIGVLYVLLVRDIEIFFGTLVLNSRIWKDRAVFVLFLA